MNIMDILQGQLSDDVIGQLSQEIGAEPQQTATAANGIFSSLLGGLANNISQEGGLQSLAGALDRDHDGSILDDLAGMVGGMMTGNAQGRNTDGMGIIGHILGDQQESTAQQVSESSGLSMGQVMKLLPVLAPILMNVLGKAKSQGGLDLGSLAGIILGGAQQQQQGGGGMGDLLGSVLGSVLGGGQQQQPQQGGLDLGGILGGIFGRR